MPITRREWFASVTAGLAWGAAACKETPGAAAVSTPAVDAPLKSAGGEVDWAAVRRLFPLSTEDTQLSSFLFVSHPKPVADAIAGFRGKLDADPTWLDRAAFSDSEGHPFTKVKESLASYIGGAPDDICMTPNTTTALSMAYQGLRIRPDQDIVTSEHDHYSHHESIRWSALRSGARVRYVPLYNPSAAATRDGIVASVERAITPKTRAVGLTWVHSSTGVKIPVADIAAVVERANRGRSAADRCLFILDGVHGFANQDADAAKLGCDFFASGAHKWLFAPRGTGFLWGRHELWAEMRPTIPTFDPDVQETWDAWKNREDLPPMRAAYLSPGGFLAFEHTFAIPAAVDLHRTIGRDHIAARIRDLNRQFREGATKIAGVTLHTPVNPDLSAGISAFEVKGFTADQVVERLGAKRFRITSSPYKISYPRVACGIMNTPEEVDSVLRELRSLV